MTRDRGFLVLKEGFVVLEGRKYVGGSVPFRSVNQIVTCALNAEWDTFHRVLVGAPHLLFIMLCRLPSRFESCQL